MANPFLLLILGQGQQEHVPGRGHIVVYFARSNNVLLFVEVVLVALDVAAATLQGWRRLEDVPQRLGAGLAVGREVIQRGDELVAFVWETVGLVALRDRLHVRLLPAFSLIGIQNLEYPWNLFCLRSVHVSLCDWSHVKQFIDI